MALPNDGGSLPPFARNVRKKRSCLMCGEMFDSKGAYNRRCPKCTRLVELGGRGTFNVPRIYKTAHTFESDYLNINNDE